MDNNQNLDAVLDRHINAQSGQGAQEQGSGTEFTRDDILNAVRQNNGENNDQTIGASEQSEDKTVASPENPAKPADNPSSAEGELDQILDEASPGTVTEDGLPVLSAQEPGGDNAASSDSLEPEQAGSAPESSEQGSGNPDSEPAAEPVETDIIAIDSENGEGITAEQQTQADPSAGGEPAVPEQGDGTSGDGAGQGTDSASTSEEDGKQDPEQNGQENSEQNSSEENNEESSSQSSQEDPSQDSEEVTSSETNIPVDDSLGDLSTDDPLGGEGDLTDGSDSLGGDGLEGDSIAEQDAQKTPEELEKESQDAQNAVQAVAEVAGEPNAAPDPNRAHEAIEKGVEGEGQEQQGVEVTDAPVQTDGEVEPPSTDNPLPDGGVGEVLQPQIGEFDSSEKILNVEQAHEPSESYQGFQRDAELIRKAGRIDKRLEDYARIITDKFPSVDSIPTEASQEDINFTRLSMIGLEAIIDNGRELVGAEYDPKNDDIVQEAVAQTSKNTLSTLAKILEDLDTIDLVVQPILAKANQLVQERDERAGENIGNEAARISSIVGVGGHINLDKLNHAPVLAGISADCQAWINGSYLAFLKGIENHEESRLSPLILNSIPTDPKSEQVRSEDVIPEGRIVRSTEVLPGGVKIVQADDRGCLSASFLSTDTVDEEADKAVTVVVPGKFELRTLLSELANVNRLSISLKDKLTNLTESLTSFYGWYEDSDPNFSEFKLFGLEDLSGAVGFMSSFASYLVSYQKGLAAYVMLPSTSQ